MLVVTISCCIAAAVSMLIVPETQGRAFPTQLPSPAGARGRRDPAGSEWSVVTEETDNSTTVEECAVGVGAGAS